MKALLLSAYDAESHRLWRENIKAMFPLIQWTELILPARYFPWRVRGNSLSWAFNHRAALTDNHDFLLCTSMCDLSALRGFVPELTGIPTAVYFHENQFAYPLNPDPLALRTNPVEPQMLSLYTALCADKVIVNSAYNRASFLTGVAQLLGKLPDHVPEGLVARLESATVLPVPLAEELFQYPLQGRAEPDVLNIAWNHRWEYDKGPALLQAIVSGLMARGVRFRLHLLGQRFRQRPAEITELEALLVSHYQSHGLTPGHGGYIAERAAYHALLRGTDVVLSTALHDFQGLSVLEAIALGCSPLAPNRLVYPEYLSAECLYNGTGSTEEQAASAVQMICGLAERKACRQSLPTVNVARFSQATLQHHYAQLIDSLVTS